MVFLHLLGVNDAEISSDVGVIEAGKLQLAILLVGEVGERSLELSDDTARYKESGSEDA